MLNITENSISKFIKLKDFNSYTLLKKTQTKSVSLRLLTVMGIIFVICMFLPWTQNINANGYVTTRSPQQRPQGIQSVISGRIESWYVQEGSYVDKGDTIVYISETKMDYFDPDLLERTTEQIDAKSKIIDSYRQKVQALTNQYNAIKESMRLKKDQTLNKILQAKNKINIDSIDLIAIEVNKKNAENQLSRTQELYDKGLKSLTELQEKENKLQTSIAKVNSQKNKLLNQRNALTNLQIELLSIENDYADKLAKSLSDKQSAESSRLESIAQTSKLKNQFSNYTERQKFYYITAPQSGYITKTLKKGIGENIKEGTDIATIMPDKYDVAVEMYIRPRDLPLLQINDPVLLRFDGWPAIVISGWPETSTGIFKGSIVAIDKYISENGFYRVIISPNAENKEWPYNLSIGTGAKAFLLLNEVPVWYELWRQLNGFPPDYYKDSQEKSKDLKLKAPIKSVK